MNYSLFCGDVFICTVSHKVERIGVLSETERKDIIKKAEKLEAYKDCNWIGYGYVTIKLNYY